jgi:hypothetical protein
MKKLIYVMFVSGLFSCASTAQVSKNLAFFKYEIECVGTGQDGTALLKVWSYAKRPKVALIEGKKNAVHGVIFKGYAGGNNCQSQQALATDQSVEVQYQDYFKTFFSTNGAYMKYVSASTDETPELVKVGREYKVGYIVSVFKDNLRSELEKQGIIRGLNSGF